MSEQLAATTPVAALTAEAVTSKTVAAPARASKSGLVIGSIALLLSIAAAGAAGWSLYVLQPQLQALQSTQQHMVSEQQSQVSFFQNKQEELQQDMQQQLVNVVADWTNKQQEASAKTEQELQKLQTQLAQQSGNVKGWQLLEIDYFLRLSEQKLFLEQNISGVHQVLDLAEQRLKQLNDASLMAVREAISQDKRMLDELNAPDLNQLHLTLSNLRQQSLTLPLRQSAKAFSEEADEEISEDTADGQENLSRSWSKFWRSLVHVRASLPEDGLSLTAEQQVSVRNTLTQQLLLAELAAMQHNQAVYAAAIQQSADSLQRYFAATEPMVQAMADELVTLSAMQVSLPLLAPLKSPQVFHAYQQGTLEAESGL